VIEKIFRKIFQRNLIAFAEFSFYYRSEQTLNSGRHGDFRRVQFAGSALVSRRPQKVTETYCRLTKIPGNT
jgi:hypothetical protein